MTNETIKLIRHSIRERLSDYASDYKIRKVIKVHLANPCAWLAGNEYDNSEDECVRRYYRNINNTFATNIYLDFKESVLHSFGIYA